ncbi:MAG: hypothetical protein AAFQ22_12565 [Pseudomonadota bacterium]
MAEIEVCLVWHESYPEGATYAQVFARHFELLGTRHTRLPSFIRVRALKIGPKTDPAELKARPENISHRMVVVLISGGLDDFLDGAIGGEAGKAFKQAFAALADEPDTTILPAMVEPGANALRYVEGLQTANFKKDKASTKLVQDTGRPTAHMRRNLLSVMAVLHAALFERTEPGAVTPQHFPIFISHARFDGSDIATALVDRLRAIENRIPNFTTFVDVQNTPAGVSYRDTFDKTIGRGALVAIQTDTYASRSFCRAEHLMAKRNSRPIINVVVTAYDDSVSLTYGGGVPTRPMKPKRLDAKKKQIVEFNVGGRSRTGTDGDEDEVVRVLSPDELTLTSVALDQILLDVLGEALRFEVFHNAVQDVAARHGVQAPIILPRQAELLDIAAMQRGEAGYRRKTSTNPEDSILDDGPMVGVYPDPVMDSDSWNLVSAVLPHNQQVQTLSQYMADLEHKERPKAEDNVQGPTDARDVLVGVSVGDADLEEQQKLGFVVPDDKNSSILGEHVFSQGSYQMGIALGAIASVIGQKQMRLGWGGMFRDADIQSDLTRFLFNEVIDTYRKLETGEPKAFFHFLPWPNWMQRFVPGAGMKMMPDKEIAITLFRRVVGMGNYGRVFLFLPSGQTVILAAHVDEDRSPSIRITVSPDFECPKYADDNLIGKVTRKLDRLQSYAFKPGDLLPLVLAAKTLNNPTEFITASALTFMRKTMAEREVARVAMSGEVNKSGKPESWCSGIVEEAVLSVESGAVFIPLGAFGGAGGQIAQALGLCDARVTRYCKPPTKATQIELDKLVGLKHSYHASMQYRGVDMAHLKTLAATSSPHEIAIGLRMVLNCIE